MKYLIVILLLIVCGVSYGQDSQGYVYTNKYDTIIKVKILYDDGNAHPSTVYGYVVRQWFVYDKGKWAGDCVNCTYPPDKWFDTEIILLQDRRTKIPYINVWQYKPLQ